MFQARKRQHYMATDPLSVSQGSFYVEFSLRLADEETFDGIRDVLCEGMEWLSISNPGLNPLTCEIEAPSPEAPAVVWQLPESFTPPPKQSLSAWFARASANGGEFEPLEDYSRWGLLLPYNAHFDLGRYVGFFVEGSEPDGDLRILLIALTRLAASALSKIERRSTQQKTERRKREVQSETLTWLENSADILWDATPDGVIRCRRILNQRTDLSQLIDRKNLRQFVVSSNNENLYEMLGRGLPIRHQPVHFLDEAIPANVPASQLIVSVTSRTTDPEQPTSFIGTFTCISRNETSAPQRLSLREKRDREERRRNDNDNMLEGLRLLVDNRSPRENLKRLIQLLCGNVGGKNPILIESGFDGQPRLVLPERKRLNYAAASALAMLTATVAEGRLAFFDEGTMEHQRLSDAFELEGRAVAVFSLPLRTQMSYMICTTEEKQQLRSEDIAFVERFAFILRQSLILRSEQAQLAQTAKMAALGQMSASIAHELKQPLNTISLATQNLESLLMMPTVDPTAVEAKLARVMSQVERASNVIDRMRRFGRKSLEESQAFNVREVIEGVLLIMGHILDRQSIEIELDLMPEMTILGDELQFEQVLMNVIQNSADAIAGIGTASDPSTNQGDARRMGKIRFRSFVSENDPGVNIIRVEDNGPGFSAAATERAAEAFFTTKPAEHGTGLGLAICESIIRDSGGRFTYGNYEGGGYVSFAMPVTTPPDRENR